MKVHRDALYLFFCHLEWHNRRNLEAYKELVAALEDRDPDIREVAESLLHRPSTCPKRQQTTTAHEASKRPVWPVAGNGGRHTG